MKAGMRSQPVAPEEEILSHSPCVSPKARATRTAVLFFGAAHLRNEQKSAVADNAPNHEHTKQVREIGQPEHSHLKKPFRVVWETLSSVKMASFTTAANCPPVL